jgi:pimeloyl-ACP methyl ester carboxylesterase
MPNIAIRDVSLFMRTMGAGYPMVLMHGGPGLDHTTLLGLAPLARDYQLLFYDHRCNGRSSGDPETMTWDNLTADADALRATFGFDRWIVLGQSFGGHVALMYVLRHPDVDICVMATHGRGGVQRAWLGSVADSMIRIAPRPVLLIRPKRSWCATSAVWNR